MAVPLPTPTPGQEHQLRVIFQEQVVVDHRGILDALEGLQVGYHNQQVFGGDHIYHQVLVVVAVDTETQVGQLQEVLMAVVVLVVLADLMVAALELVDQVVLEELLLDMNYSII